MYANKGETTGGERENASGDITEKSPKKATTDAHTARARMSTHVNASAPWRYANSQIRTLTTDAPPSRPPPAPARPRGVQKHHNYARQALLHVSHVRIATELACEVNTNRHILGHVPTHIRNHSKHGLRGMWDDDEEEDRRLDDSDVGEGFEDEGFGGSRRTSRARARANNPTQETQETPAQSHTAHVYTYARARVHMNTH